MEGGYREQELTVYIYCKYLINFDIRSQVNHVTKLNIESKVQTKVNYLFATFQASTPSLSEYRLGSRLNRTNEDHVQNKISKI